MVVYRLQRSATARDNTPPGWTTLAETTGRTWTGPAEPGWTYRVGTVRVTKGDVANEDRRSFRALAGSWGARCHRMRFVAIANIGTYTRAVSMVRRIHHG